MALNEDRYQKIRVRMWRGETVPQLSRDAKLLWVYLLSSPDTTMIPGLLSVGVGSIADDLGYSPDEVRVALAEIEATGEVHFDPAGLVWFRKALQHNPPDSPNHVKGWRRHWSEVRTCALKDVAWTEIRSWLAEHRGQTFVQPFDLVCPRPVLSKNQQNRSPSPIPSPIPSGNPSRSQKQYQEQKQNQETQSAGAGAPACACTHEAAPDTSPSGRVVAEVVSTEPPPPRLPPVPVEVAPSVPATVPPSSHATGPLAASDDQDDDQPPPAQRVPSTPRPGPVAAVAPAAPVEAAPAVTPAAVPVAASSEQLALVPPAEAPAVDPVVVVFDHWRETVWKSRAVLNDRRRSRIAARIAEGYSVDDLKRVADGVLRDDWLMGRADGARPEGWRDVETVYRDAGQVERLIKLAALPPGAIRPRTQRAHYPANVAPPQPRDPGKIVSPFGTVMTFDDDEDDAPAPPRGGYRMASGDAAGGAL